jgi:K+-sensing histidine kinase KdpD
MTGLPIGGPPGLDIPAAAEDDIGIRGLLHDLGHQMMTLSLLTESVRDDAAIPASSRWRMELVLQEMLRAMDMITDYLPAQAAAASAPETSSTDVRRMAVEVAQLAGLAYETAVTVRPGRPATIQISPTVLWRVLANLVDNAVRAAGPDGSVEIRVEQELDTVIEVVDDGPGPERGPHGMRGLGLSVVGQLLDLAGGHLEMARARPAGGTRARLVFGLAREYTMIPACAGPWH